MDNLHLPSERHLLPPFRDGSVVCADFTKLDRQLAAIPQRIATLRTLHQTLYQEQQALYSAGLIEAYPYWHQGKYLYLIHPMKNGLRKREYIGADPRKLSHVLVALRRATRYKKITARLQSLETQIGQATSLLDRFLWLTLKAD